MNIVLILTGKEKDGNLQMLIRDKIRHTDLKIKIRTDPLREKPALLTSKGMFQGEGGIRFYLDRFVVKNTE